MVKGLGNCPTFSGNYPTYSGNCPTFLGSSPRAIWRSYTLSFVPNASISGASSIQHSLVVIHFCFAFEGASPLACCIGGVERLPALVSAGQGEPAAPGSDIDLK